MVTRYDAAYLGLAPLALPWLAWRWLRRGKYRRSAPGMMGRGLPAGEEADRFSGGSVWIHAVSVGETAAAAAVEPGLRTLFPDLPFVISTVTETGQDAARRTLPEAEAHTYFPADLSWNVERFLGAFRPRVVVLLEAEIWPNFLTMAHRRGARVFLLNGRMSDRSFPRYRRARRLFGGTLDAILGSIRGFCVQTEQDARRFGELGIESDRIRVTGNCKFDLEIEELSPQERETGRAELGIAPDRPVIIAGSTHEGEEAMILDAFARVRTVQPDACLVLAPRHPERFARVADLARERNSAVRLATDPPPASLDKGRCQVVILDRMGALARSYGLADVAIVAGSFCPTGGHNLLEAAAHRIPVIYGPNMRSQRELAQLFEAASAGTQVEPRELGETLIQFLGDAELRRTEGEKAFGVLRANQGSAARCIEAMTEWMQADGPTEE